MSELLTAQSVDSIAGRCENEAGTTSLCPRMETRGGSNVIDEITHGLQQHLSWTELCWVRQVFARCRPGVFFDRAQGVTPGPSIPFCARHHLKTVESLLPLAFAQLSDRTHGRAGTPGCGLQGPRLVLAPFLPSSFGVTSPLLPPGRGIPPRGVGPASTKQAAHTFSSLRSCPFSYIETTVFSGG